MANYCKNTLIVKGDLDQLNHFLSKVKDLNSREKFTLENIYPVPNKNLDIMELDNWKNCEWGTTSISESNIQITNVNEASISFISKWSPPINWVKYVARQYGNLAFSLKYKEEEIGFYGSIHIQGYYIREFNNVSFIYSKENYKNKIK